MVALNQLQRAMVDAGLVKEPKEKRKHYKQFKCKKCGARMYQAPDTNVMACEQCGNYYIFSRSK